MNMKKTMTFLAALLMSTGSIMADEVSIGNVTIPQGGQATVSISLNNPDKEYTAGQMLLALPEGVTAVLKENGEPTTTKGERLQGTSHTIGASHLEDGTDQFTIFSISSEAISGTDGTLFTVLVTADAELAVDSTLEGRLTDIEMTTTDATPTSFNVQTFTITIGAPDDLPREAYAVYKDSVLTFYYDCNVNCRKGKICTNFQPYFLGWSDIKSDIKVVVFDNSFAEYNQLKTIRTWFQDCYNLEKVVGMENLITTNVSDMTRLFRGCHKLETIDVSSFDTRNVKQMEYMFYGCSSLTTIYCGTHWTTDNVTSSSNMFNNCTSLVGGAGTTYDYNHKDASYAHVDGGPDNPGYLTLKGSGTPVYALGDVNRDGSVDIGDIVMTINVMTGSETDADIMATADVNSDDCVDIGDIVAIIDIMTSSPAAARAQRATAATDADDYIEATATGNDIVVGLNNQHAFTAFQMVLTLPAGCTLNEVLIDSKRSSRHIAEVKSLANGSYLVMGYSLNNKLLKGSEGLLFTISTAGAQPTGAVISDVLFATAEGGTYRLAGIEVGTAGTTGVSTVNGRTETADPVYDLNGRRRVAKAKDALLPGLYIINGKKTVIK